MTKLIIFDLDGTLAESKQPLDAEMAVLFTKLLEKTNVGIISGCAFSQYLTQVVARLPDTAQLSHLYLLPTSGAALYEWADDNWKKIYEERLSETDAKKIEDVINAAIEETDVIDRSKPAWGDLVEYRGSQVTLSALGQRAPIDEKKAWDPDLAKRRILVEHIAPHLPDFLVAIAGGTSIDVTKKGIDKAYGVRKLCERLNIQESDALYVGDKLEPGGNDEAVFKTEIKTKAVTNPEDTKRLIESELKED